MADEIKNAFDWWQRDYRNQLDPNSGPNPPHKPDGRTAGEVIQEQFDGLTASTTAATDALSDRVDVTETDIAAIEAEIDSLELEADSITKGTWAALSAIVGTRNGQRGQVTGPDAGTHTDPVVGGTVANMGTYAWSTSPAGWQWLTANPDFTQVVTLTGDQSVAGVKTFSSTPVVPDNSFGNAKLANRAAATITGRKLGAGTGAPQDMTGDETLAIIAPDVNFADLPTPGSAIQFRRVDGEYLAYSADGKWLDAATGAPIVPAFVRDGMEDAYVSANFTAAQYFNNWTGETNKTQATLADFFTAAGGTFTRAHTAKYYSGLGTMAEAASGVARIQYNPGSGTALGLLIEGSFTNIANYSEAIAGGNGYVYTNVTVTANAAVAPDGTTTMDRIHASVAGGVAVAHNVAIPQQAFTSGQYYSMSVYVAAAGVTSVRLRFPTQAFASNNATFTLSGAGSISDNYGSAAKIENVGSGRYRLTITQASNASNTAYPTLLLGSADFIGDGTSGVDAWGFMIYNDRGHRMYYPALTASDAAFAGETLTFSRGIPADGATVLIRIVVPDIDASQTLWYWVESANSFIRLYIEAGTLKFRVRQDASTIPIDATMGVVTAGTTLEVIARVQEGAYRVQRADTGFVITGSTSHVPSSATFWLGGNSSSVGLEAPIAEWVISPPKTDRQMSDIIGVTDSGGEEAGYEFATEELTYTSTIQPVGNGITNGTTTNFNPLSMRISYNNLGTNMIPLVVMHGWSEDYDVSGIYPALHEQFTLDDRVVIAVGMRGNAAGNDSTADRYPWRDGGRNEIHDIFDALDFVRATLNARRPGMVNEEFAGIVGYSGGGGNVTSVLGHTDNTIFQFGADHFGIKLYGNAAYAGNATLGGWWEQSVIAGNNQRLRQMSDATLGTRTASGTPVVGTPTTNPNAYMMSDNRSALVANLIDGQKIAFFHAPSDASVQYSMTLATTNALDAASKTGLYYANISEDWVHGYPDGFAQDSHPYWNPIFNELIEAGLTEPAIERTGVRVNGFWYSKRLKIQLVNNDASRTPEPIHVATADWNLLTRVITLTKVSTTNAAEPNAGTFIAMIDLDGNRTEVTLTGTATTTIQMKLGGGHIVL